MANARKHGLWWWIDRYRKSTAYTDMTLAEQGAYRNLLDEQRLRGDLLPNDERILAKVCGDALEWPAVRGKVLARFEVTEDGKHLFNRTATEVNAVTDALSAVRAESGRVGYERVERGDGGRFTGKSAGKSSGNGTGKRTGKATGSVSVVRSPLPLSVSGATESVTAVEAQSSSGGVRGGNGRAAADEDYVQDVLTLYCRVPGTRDEPTKADRALAHVWCRSGVPLAHVRAGILKATAHREGRTREAPLEPINSLAYFRDEVTAMRDYDPEYLEHLASLGEGFLKPVESPEKQLKRRTG